MRRSSYRRGTRESGGTDAGFWPSYADMMSAVALILFFLMLLAYIQNMITGNNLKDTQALLNAVEVKLSDTELELSTLETELESTRATLQLTLSDVDSAKEELSHITIELSNAQLVLSQQKEAISQQDAALAEKNATLQTQTAELERQASLIQEQEEYVKLANDELLAMREQMKTIAVFRLSTLEDIRNSLVNIMGDPTAVAIGNNGNIVLSSSVLFEYGKAEVLKEAEPVLRQLSRAFQTFLQDENNIQYVDSIVVSGHTDDVGDESYNRDLSTDRANSVLKFLMEPENGNLEAYSSYFLSAGYGKSRPMADNNTEAGRAANRRIEISIILKDESILSLLDTYLALNVPGQS